MFYWYPQALLDRVVALIMEECVIVNVVTALLYQLNVLPITLNAIVHDYTISSKLRKSRITTKIVLAFVDRWVFSS